MGVGLAVGVGLGWGLSVGAGLGGGSGLGSGVGVTSMIRSGGGTTSSMGGVRISRITTTISVAAPVVKYFRIRFLRSARR